MQTGQNSFPSVTENLRPDFAGEYFLLHVSSASDRNDIGSSRHDPSFGDHPFTGVAIALGG